MGADSLVCQGSDSLPAGIAHTLRIVGPILYTVPTMTTLFSATTVLDYDALLAIADASFAALGLYGWRYNDAMATACEWALTAADYSEAERIIDQFASMVADSEEAEY